MKKLNRKITKAIANQADKAAVQMEVVDIKEKDNAVFANLLGMNDEAIAKGRVFTLDRFPAVALELDEKEYLKDKPPAQHWKEKTIQKWLDDNSKRDEEGNVIKEYTGTEKKAVLLSKVTKN